MANLRIAVKNAKTDRKDLMGIPQLEAGTLHWGQRKVTKTEQLAYYNLTEYTVPVSGKVVVSKIYAMLLKKLFRPHHNVFGGYTSLDAVQDLGNGFVMVRTLYHIGE